MSHMSGNARRGWRRAGFSLIELVIVVVIIGIIAAIAVPKLSRGAAGASDSALSGDLKVLRTALDMYATEHGGVYPSLTNLQVGALTGYTDDAGDVKTAKDPTHIYGPYLRAVPPLPVGGAKGKDTFIGTADGSSAGWVYEVSGTSPTTYKLTPNTTTEKDAKGTLYNTY